MKKEPTQTTKPTISFFDLDLVAAGGAVMAFVGLVAKSLIEWLTGG